MQTNKQLNLPIRLEGIGRYLPQRIVTNSELEKLYSLPEGWIEQHNGVRERRWADRKRETNAFMGARAAEEALSRAGLSVKDVDLILNASGTPQQAIPETSPLIQYELGPNAYGIACMSISATCLSFIVALDAAASFLASERYQRILIVTSDIASGHLNPNDPETATLLGDVAAAVVVSLPSPEERAGIIATHLETYSEGAHLTEIIAGGSYLSVSDTESLRKEHFYFSMQGRKVLRLAKKYLPGFLETLHTGLSSSLVDIDMVVPHQASMMGLKLLSGFNWPEERIGRTLHFLGNTVAASIPATLYEMIECGRLKRGDKTLLLGTGAGLSIGGLILIY